MTSITGRDRMLPNQPHFMELYNHPMIEYYARLENCLLSVSPLKTVHDKLNITLKNGLSYEDLGSSLQTLQLYQMLIRIGGYRDVLEIGTYLGVSALFLAEAVSWTGRVTTIEIGQEFYDLAKQNLQANRYGERVKQIHGDAKEQLMNFFLERRTFDFIVMDGAKEDYDIMLPLAMSCLSRTGTLVVDDIFFQGDTLNDEPQTEKGKGVKRFIDIAAELPGCDKTILPMGNGLMLITRNFDHEEPFYHAN